MKQTHAEGLRSILRSRIARGVFPLVAVLFACALAAPEARAAATTLPEGVELTDLTSPSGTVTTTTSGDWVKPAKNAFDNGTAHNNDDRSIHSGTTAAYDSYRFAVTAVQSGSDSYVQIDELEFFFINQGGPTIRDVSLARTGALAYSLSATEDANAADLSYILSDGETVSTNGWRFSVDCQIIACSAVEL